MEFNTLRRCISPIPIRVSFSEFYRETDIAAAPAKSGIYTINKCIIKGNTIDHLELLYVGEAANINSRLTNDHEKIPLAQNLLNNDEVLVLNWAEVPNHDNRELAEKAIITATTPHLNDRVDSPSSTASHNAVHVTGHLKIPSKIILEES